MQTIFKGVPLKKKGKLSKLFHLILRGLIPHRTKFCEVSDPQNKILRGIRPSVTKSCWVSDPAEQLQRCVNFIADACSAGSDTPQKNVLWGLILRRTKSCGISDLVGYLTPQNKVLRGIRPRGTTLNTNISTN
jgi:hypothetical protein